MKSKQVLVILIASLIFGSAVLCVVLLHQRTTPPKAGSEEWKISMEEAVNKVKDLPEVEEFLKRGETRKTDEFGTIVYSPVVSADLEPSESNLFWTVHVWDDVTEYDREGKEISGHSATFGWYKVNARTGEVVKELP